MTLSTLWDDLASALAGDPDDWYSREHRERLDRYIDARISAALGQPVIVKPLEVQMPCQCIIENGQIRYLCILHETEFRRFKSP